MALVLVIAFVNGQAVHAAPPDSIPSLSPEQQHKVQSILQEMVLNALHQVEDRVNQAMSQTEDFPANNLLAMSTETLQNADFSPNQTNPNPNAQSSKTNVVWCWIDNFAADEKYKPCILPFLIGPQQPYEYPITAARSLQAAIDQASALAVRQGRSVPVIVLPSFMPELLQILTFGLCGDENYEGYEEQIQLKPGVIVIGVPLLLEPVKIISPNDGPAVSISTLYGASTTLQDVLDDLKLELNQIASELTTSVIGAASEILAERLATLATDAVETGLNTALDSLVDFAGSNENEFFGFIKSAFSALDSDLIKQGAALGLEILPIADQFTGFSKDFEKNFGLVRKS